METNLHHIIREKANAIFDKVREIRHHLHMHPELSYEEFKTMEYVSQILIEHNISHEKGIGKTGVVALIRNEQHPPEMPSIGLRCDLDALPITEENNVPYRSRVEGVMHACGHDVHTAVLLGAALILNEMKDQLPQPVKLIFQPGEEMNPGGATLMIRDGVLSSPAVTEMIALHVFPDLEVGKVGFKEGIYMASCDEIHLTINGKGGHGATPHQCIDPIVVGANIILQLQQIVSRKCDPKIPCVLSFGHFEALGATNVIPSKACLKGTFRTMNEEWRKEALQLIDEQIKAIAHSHGATVELIISKGYPYLENDPTVTASLREKAVQFLGKDNVVELPIRLTSEDFSYYSQEIPVCFFRLGVRNEQTGVVHGVHHPKFDIDENALKIGIEMMCLAVF
ncbi:MAG: M20 family metallopeptidase [Flavobacteriia bacterium]